MIRLVAPLCLTIALAGCAAEPAPPTAGATTPPPATPPASRPAGGPIATAKVADVRVTLDRDVYLDFLRQTRGLDAALNLMTRELAREQARQAGATVDADDIAAERERTLQQAFGEQIAADEYEQALDQLLTQQGLSEAEFNLAIETNALLRASADASVEGALTEDALRQEFGRRYGERARVRAISLPTLRGAADAKARADAGAEFEQLARELNDDPTLATTGGQVEPFTRTSSLPEPVKAAAFALAPGETSDPVQSEGRFLVLRLEEILPPVAVKFEDVRDELAAQIESEFADAIVVQSREQYPRLLATPGVLSFDDPVLTEQLEERLAAARPRETSPEELKRRMEQDRPTSRPTTRP